MAKKVKKVKKLKAKANFKRKTKYSNAEKAAILVGISEKQRAVYNDLLFMYKIWRKYQFLDLANATLDDMRNIQKKATTLGVVWDSRSGVELAYYKGKELTSPTKFSTITDV